MLWIKILSLRQYLNINIMSYRNPGPFSFAWFYIPHMVMFPFMVLFLFSGPYYLAWL